MIEGTPTPEEMYQRDNDAVSRKILAEGEFAEAANSETRPPLMSDELQQQIILERDRANTNLEVVREEGRAYADEHISQLIEQARTEARQDGVEISPPDGQ